jgi:chromosome segregation ATPase
VIYRVWRLFVALITFGIVRLEKNTASMRRQAIIDQHVQQVAAARRDLGTIRGAGRAQQRSVSDLETRVRTLSNRKTYYMDKLKAVDPDSPEAIAHETKARETNTELKAAQTDLAAEQKELDRISAEYHTTKAIIKTAGNTVKQSRAKGERMTRRQESAKRRKGALEAVASIRGLAGATDELAQIDAQLEDELDMVEGQAETTADLAQEEWQEQQLDRTIASQSSDDEFERELAAARGTAADVIDVDTVRPALTAGDPSRTLVLPTTTPETVLAQPKSVSAYANFDDDPDL